MESQAVLLVAHYIVSLFNVQLGNPVMKPYPYPTMAVCQEYAGYMQGQEKLDLEWMLVTRTQCITMAEFNRMQAQRLAAQGQQSNE